MRGYIRCVDGDLYRHDPQHDDPYLETNVGRCEACAGRGCGDEAEPEDEDGEFGE